MFSRAPRASHVCLRCSKYPTRQVSRPSAKSARSFLDGGRVRHQSALATKTDDIAEDQEDGQSAHLFDANHGSSVEDGPSRRPRHYYTRKVRIAETAGIGVEALGKPSEIILLPSHDRKLPKSVEYTETPKLDLSAAIESEKVPLRWEQVKEYIEKAHSGLDTQQGPLSQEEWNALRVALTRGFSKAQLRRFLQEESAHRPAIPEDAGRRAYIALIATHVWGYELPLAAQPPSDAAAERHEAGTSTVTANVEFTNEQDLLLLQRDAEHGLQSLTRKYGVSIVVRGRSVTIKGSKNAVNVAKGWLQKHRTRTTRIDLDGFAEAFFTETSARDMRKRIAELDQRIGAPRAAVLTRSTKDGMQVRFLQPNKTTVPMGVRRDLRLLAEDNFRPCFLASSRPERVTFVPYFTEKAQLWGRDKHWRRACDTIAGTSTGHTRRAETAVWVDEQWKEFKKRLEHPLHKLPVGSPNAPRCEYSARMGMNLYDHSPTSTHSGLSNPNRASWFVDDVPLLMPLLTNKELRERPGPSKSDVPGPSKSDVPVDSPFLQRLLLKPVHLDSSAPSVEIWLYGQDPAAGLRQSLNIARVTAVLKESQTRHLSLPTLPIDVSVDRQVKQDLFVSHSPGTSQCPALLRAIGTYLAKTRRNTTDTPNFFSFTSMSTSVDLADFAEAVSGATGANVEYFLAAAELVKSRACLLPDLLADEDGTRLVLEHTTYDGGQYGPQRQEVRLVQQPLLTVPPKAGVSLDTLKDASLFVGEKIGDLGRQLRHRMQALK
jgi:hypothetical protein